MRRKNSVAVKVMAPSRGLVTRFPSNTADAFHPTTPTTNGDKQRVCTLAQNMRFEDGVMTNAPGVQRVTLSNDVLTGLLAHWRMDEASGDRQDFVGSLNLTSLENVLGVPGHIGLAASLDNGRFQGDAGGFTLFCDPPSDLTGDFTLTGWVNFGQVTGTDQIAAAGIESDLGFVLLRVGTAIQFSVNGSSSGSITSSVTLAANTWYFVAARLDTSGNLLSIQVNSTLTAGGGGSYSGGINLVPFYILGFGPSETLPFLVDSFSLWTRKLSDGEVTTIYNSGTGLDYPFLGGPFNLVYQGNITGGTPTPTFIGNDSSLYTGNKGADYVLTLTQILTGAATSPGYRWAATDFIDKVVFAKNSAAPRYWNTSTGSATLPVPGLATGTTFDGVESFFGHLLFWSGNTLTWSDLNDITNYIPVGATSDTAILTIGLGGFTQPTVGTPLSVLVTSYAGIAVNGGFYRIDDGIGASATTSFYTLTPGADTTHVNLTLLNKTGRRASGTTMPAGSLLVPLTANEAGSAVIFGSDANGPIFQVVASGDYAYVFKERSIQSLQYVGLGSGIFYIRTAVTNEGLLARYGLVNLGMGRIIFLGQRELYDYHGDSNPTPICQQYTRQLFSELDRNHLEQLVMMHRELRNEIWLVYPSLGGVLKVLVWNYLEDTASIDIYDPSMMGFTAARMMDWQTDPAWLSLSDTDTWANYSPSVRWEDLAGAGKERVAVLASGDGNLLIHGNVYNRLGAAYTSFAETMDFDFEDDAAFKYVDVVNLALQVRTPDNTPRNLSVQVGYRPTLDADITYTPAALIQVQGNANFTAKVNPGGAGRYIRLRFQSSDADVQFRISGFEIFARMGGTY